MSIKADEQALKIEGMRLTELQGLRERTLADLTLGQDEVLERFSALSTPIVSDVLRELTLTEQALPGSFMRVNADRTLVGFAFTIRSTPDPTVSGEMDVRVKMLDQIQTGDVIVWDGNGQLEVALWGEVMSASAGRRGAIGAVLDGGLRDTPGVLELGFPVWYRYHSPNGSLSRAKITDFLAPIKMGTVLIHPRDLVIADIDGAVIVPRAQIAKVLERAEQILANEAKVKQWVQEDVDAQEILDRGGYF